MSTLTTPATPSASSLAPALSSVLSKVRVTNKLNEHELLILQKKETNCFSLTLAYNLFLGSLSVSDQTKSPWYLDMVDKKDQMPVFKLSQDNFVNGTCRIRKPGYYMSV